MSGISVSKQQIQEIYTKVELLDDDDFVIDELQGIVTGGNISIDESSMVRRTCNLSILLNNNSLIPKDRDSRIWFDKRFKLYIGVKDFYSGEIEWFNKGIYYFQSPSISFSKDDSTISVEGLDKMCLFDSDHKGSVGYKLKINANTPVFEAVKNLISLVGETNYIISDVEDMVIPYDMTKDEDSSVIDFLTEIRDLYMGYEFFYTEDGIFVWQKIRDRKYDNVEYIFDEDDKSIISYSNAPDFKNIKNKVIVWGKQFNNKAQITSTLSNNDNNKFGIKYIGERLFVYTDDTIQTQQQADLRAEYELENHSNLNESININAIQILSLDVNRVITVNKDSCGIEGNFLIKRLSYQLDNSGTMTIEAKKLYYN